MKMMSSSSSGDGDDEGNLSFNTTSAAAGDEDDEYIEIAINQYYSKQHEEEEEEEEEYLRISFSFSSSSSAQPIISESDHRTTNIPNNPQPHFTFSHSVINHTSSSSAATDDYDDDDDENQKLQTQFITLLPHNLHLPLDRKSGSSKTKATTNNINSVASTGIMKLLMIKLRGIKIGSLLASLLKPRRLGAAVVPPHDIVNNNNNNGRKKTYLDKWQVQRNNDQITSSRCGGDEGERSNRMMEMINMGAVRGVLEAVSFAISTNINGRNHRKTRSCPTSINSSPLHHSYYSTDDSIQSAIAHCKTSFARHDFSF